MRWLVGLAVLAVLAAPAPAQDSRAAEELRRKIDRALREETDRVRAELRELVEQELRGAEAPPKAAAPAAASVERAKGLVTVELLKQHVQFLASDALQGRAAGYPGCERAAEYVADVMKRAGLRPAGDGGTYFQKFRVSGRETKNCVGLLEGSDPDLKKEYLVIGGHHDHVGTSETEDFGRLGRAREGDTIWNGADDNASGTSAVLSVVRAFGEGGVRARRSILFMTFSGEEAGLLGSAYYARNPIAPIAQHVFMLNLDMVGRNPDKPIEIHGVGSAGGGLLRKAFDHAVKESGLKAKFHEQVALMGGDSDHTSFANKRVPFSFFFSGFHPDYHRVTDHADKLAYENMVKVAHTSIHVLLEVGNGDERPRFTGKVGPSFQLPDPGEALRPSRRLGVTVLELDDAESERMKLAADAGGLRVQGLTSGSVADASGVKVGDVLLEVAGVALPRADPREKLRKLLSDRVSPGKEVDVVVWRNGERVTLKAKWSE